MKRFAAIFFAVVMIVSVCLIAASCGSEPVGETTTTKNVETVITNADGTKKFGRFHEVNPRQTS